MPKFFKKILPKKLARDTVTTRSVTGQGVPAIAPARRLGMPPKSPFRSGTTGDRSSSFDVTASQLMQQTMTDDDIEYYKELEDDKPYDVLRTYIAEVLLYEAKEEAVEVEEDPDEEVEEASVAAGVAGYTLPLGMSNKKKDEDPPWKAYARAFARANLANP